MATSKPAEFARHVLQQHQLHWLPAVRGADLDGQLTKADLIAAALDDLGADASRSVMVGDRRFDIEGGQQHDLATIGVTYGFGDRAELEQAGADMICDSVEELGAALRNFLGQG